MAVPTLQSQGTPFQDVIQWLGQRYYIRLHHGRDNNTYYHDCLLQPLNDEAVLNYLENHWVISINFEVFPELLSIWIQALKGPQYRQCQCSLRNYVQVHFLDVPHQRNWTLPYSVEDVAWMKEKIAESPQWAQELFRILLT